MTITIDVPPDTEEQLRAQSEATGKTIDVLVLEAVQARLALAQIQFGVILDPVHADFRRSGMTEDELDTLLEDSLKASRQARQANPRSSA
jgi:hypothetical protein